MRYPILPLATLGWLAATGLASAAPAPASGPLPGSSISELLSSSRLEWSGELETTANSYSSVAYGQSTAQEGVVRARLEPSLGVGRNYDFKSNILLRADASDPTRNTVRPDEAYVSIRAGNSLTFHAGKILYSWGNDALYNPTDFLNPRDYYDLYHVDKLGVISLDANYALSDTLSLDVGVVPAFQPSIVSDPTSRWINYTPFVSQAAVSQLGLPANLQQGYSVPFDLAQRSPKLPQLFARLSLKSLLLDASVSYSYRYNPFPQVVLFSSVVGYDAINGVPVGQVLGVPYYQHEHFFAFDANIPVGGFFLFVNSSLSLPDAAQGDIPSDTTILSNYNNAGVGAGVDLGAVDNARSTTTATLTVGVRRDWSHFHAYVQAAKIAYLSGQAPLSLFSQAVQGSGLSPSDFYNFYSGTLVVGAQWDPSGRWSLRSGSVFNLKEVGALIDATLQYRVSDGFRVSVGADWLGGQGGSVFGFYSGNSRGFIDLDLVF